MKKTRIEALNHNIEDWLHLNNPLAIIALAYHTTPRSATAKSICDHLRYNLSSYSLLEIDSILRWVVTKRLPGITPHSCALTEACLKELIERINSHQEDVEQVCDWLAVFASECCADFYSEEIRELARQKLSAIVNHQSPQLVLMESEDGDSGP